MVVPAFSVERTQEFLYDLNILTEAEGLNLPSVFLDGPLGIEATEVYEEHARELSFELPDGFTDNDVFSFPGLERTKTVEESKKINSHSGSKIIIAGAGMMNAGRVQHHLVRYLPDPKNTLLIIGYQGKQTLGRAIQSGETPVDILGYSVDVKCKIETMDSYSAHADFPVLSSWIKAGRPKKIALVHGDEAAQSALAKHLGDSGFSDVSCPSMGVVLEI